MTQRTLAIQSERIANQYALATIVSNVDGDQADDFILPSGFGDCLLLNCGLYAGPIATAGAVSGTFAEHGPAWFQYDAGAAAILDIIGTTDTFRWTRVGDAVIAANCTPRQTRLWRRNESILVAFSEIDTNAVPTADVRYMFLVRRLQI